ncbi:YgcG family protein, partial [Oxalobacteraceae bacterium OM1]
MSAALRLLLACLLACALNAGAQDFVPVPQLTARVTDQIGLLDAGQRQTLENVLKDYEDRSGSQIAILIVKTTAPEAIEQYSIRVFDQWKLGRKGVDDGVLLIVARDNPPSLRRLRIEAGRGVQGSLTDAQSKRILQDVIAPHFRQNDFYGGLSAGVSAISALIDKEKLPAAERKAAQDDEGPDTFSFALVFIFVVLFIILSRMRSARGYTHRRGGWGGPGIIIGGGGGGSGGGFG